MAKSKSKRPSPQSQALIKQKKHSAALLRRLGLYSPNVPRITNATVKNSGSLKRKLREYRDVIEGRSKAIKVGAKAARAYKQEGYRAAGTRVIVAVRPQQRVYARSGKIVRKIESAPLKQSKSGIEDCLDRLREWFYMNADFSKGGPETRFDEVEKIARANPKIFFRVVNSYHARGMDYLNRRKPKNPKIPGWEIFEDYVELFYYHPTSSDSTVTGGVIPKC